MNKIIPSLCNDTKKGGADMQKMTEGKPLYVGVDTVAVDFGVSRAKAYAIIKNLNEELKKENPRAIVVAGKVNRIFYEECAGIRR